MTVFAIQPHLEMRRLLLQHVSTYDAYQLAHYSEQTGLACFFYQGPRTLSTLPCTTLYDISNHRHLKGKPGYTSCARWGGQGRKQCDLIAKHIHEQCYWHIVAREVRAIHFKGVSKPWERLSGCPGIDAGRVKVKSSGDQLQYYENLRWNVEEGACLCPTCTTDQGLVIMPTPVITWSSGQAIPRQCCNLETLIAVEWYWLRGEMYMTHTKPKERVHVGTRHNGTGSTAVDGDRLLGASQDPPYP